MQHAVLQVNAQSSQDFCDHFQQRSMLLSPNELGGTNAESITNSCISGAGFDALGCM